MASRAERRRAEREGRILDPVMKSPKGTGEIQLFNPVAQHFPAFIFGNSTKCDRVVPAGTGLGRSVAICGAGPSLREQTPEWFAQFDEVWGVNSAAPWLHTHGYPVTHAFTVDQTPTMLKEWVDRPPLEYLVASTAHPHLVDYLLAGKCSLTFFHNFVNIPMPPVSWEDENGQQRTEPYEDWMYMMLYPGTVRAGSGLNGVTRAVDVATYRGFSRIVLVGAEHSMRAPSAIPDELKEGSPELVAWLDEHTEFHVDGGSAVVNGQSAMVMQATIDGRLWTTKVDLVISAVQIARWLQAGLVETVGDGLPEVFARQDEDFFKRLPSLQASDGTRIQM